VWRESTSESATLGTRKELHAKKDKTLIRKGTYIKISLLSGYKTKALYNTGYSINKTFTGAKRKMANFRQRSDRRERRGAHGSNRGGFGRGRGRREPVSMHQAVCDECKQECEVPFKPTSSKPIFCSDCFKKKGGSGKSGQNGKEFAQINEKLDKIMEALKVK